MKGSWRLALKLCNVLSFGIERKKCAPNWTKLFYKHVRETDTIYIYNNVWVVSSPDL